MRSRWRARAHQVTWRPIERVLYSLGIGGEFEFRRDALVGMDSHTPAQELDKVEYRGGGKHVVVLPKTTIKLIEFDFETPDRIRWTTQNNCVLVRAKGLGFDSINGIETHPIGVPAAGQTGLSAVAA